jgi:hypothetical protein
VARIHGRNARIYMGIASDTASAEPLPFYASWSISFATEKAEVTAFGDSVKVYVAGLPDASGEFSGFFDNATAQTYTAAVDGLPRKFYLYPSNTGTPGTAQYFFGTILPDMSIDTSVSDSVKVSASWNAASAVSKVG